MKFSKFCPMCGKETEVLYGDEKKLCAECYPRKHDLLDIPDEVKITLCSVCGRMKSHGEWIEEYSMRDQLLEAFSEFNEENVEMQLQFWEDDNEVTRVKVHASRDRIEDSYESRIEFNKTQCKDCARFENGFYKVKLQLRGEKDLEPVSNAIVDRAAEATNDSRKDFLSNVEKHDHGFDFYLSTERINKKILSVLRERFDPEIQRSYELIGEERGEEVYRNVVSVRL